MRAPSPIWMAYMQAKMDREEREKKRAANATLEFCPRCGGQLYRREGKYGEFLGCGNYPNCNYTKKL